MSLHTLWIFATAVFLLSGTPGPNMLHIMSRSVELGFKRSMAAMAGCLLGLLSLLTASAVGLGALLHALPGVFDALRLAGAAYLLYLAVKAWRSPVAEDGTPVEWARPTASWQSLLRGGFAISISNPKAIIFAAAFLPQFIDPAKPQAPQFATLLAVFTVIEGFWYCIYATGGRAISRHLSRAGVKRAFNRITGGLFAGFGLSLLAWRAA
ncbi:LysE family translocator [Novosphingobium beihaiensis]|uniref:LysE family translocator n=1 Tax=Novosphingobium beihaiensis TaxID=2930389 RepID=A0ABT0BPS7_9SPHN|nr:LysE family translocator [Novosphingobium beihaiensis]MCJ2187054.1 LysE family translocator [Novosphingobium beihaiensis]